MKRKQRETEIFSLSFLDVICCGFGAIILLLVLSEFGQPLVIEKSRNDLESQLKRLQEELFVIRGDSERLERELKGRVDVLQKERLNLARASRRDVDAAWSVRHVTSGGSSEQYHRK